jgi:hypothetical protein
MINKDTRLHPFEVSFAAMVKKARASARERVLRPRAKEIPAHILPRMDEELGYGMYNYRLDQWVKEEYAQYHRIFRTEALAETWYRGLI